MVIAVFVFVLAEESHDVKTDTELYGMYNMASPMKKKPRTDEVGDELQRFMFASEDNAQGIFV